MRLLLSSVLLGLGVVRGGQCNRVADGVDVWLLDARAVRECSRRAAPARAMLLTTRLLPAVASSVFVLAVFLPAHWRFEPAETDESFGLVLGGLAAIGLSLALAQCVACRSGACLPATASPLWRGVRGLWSRAMRDGAFELGGLPGVSLAGIWRPRILIGSEALSALTPAELDVAISHEVAHRRSQDNLKRFLMFCAPDLFGWTRVARQLEERWQAEAECEADARAVRGDGQRAVVLASALVKVARLGCAGTLHPVSPWGRQERSRGPPRGAVERVSRADAARDARAAPRVWFGACLQSSRARLAWSTATVSLGILAGLWLLDFSYTLHLVTEAMVTLLP